MDIKHLHEVHTIQKKIANETAYHAGFYNGLELALCILEDRSPVYVDCRGVTELAPTRIKEEEKVVGRRIKIKRM